ncbi:MAG: permease prefix domain 1-containing protein [Terriglobales bacterium]
MPDWSAPDWTGLVRERLHPLGLPSKEAQEVVAEVATHLEDFYEEQIEKGLSESEARQSTLNEVIQWHSFARNIQRAKHKEETMNARTKHLWLPGLVSLAAAMGSLMILIQISLQPRLLGRSPLQMVILPWLVLLPLCGGAGAYLSRRGGADRRVRLIAGLFPTIVLFILGAILVLTRLVVLARPQWWNGSLAIAIGIVLPSAALLLGTVPFLRSTERKVAA